ncbi:MAG: hypothetical protein V4580_07415 [Bacteroidota bacterium]
MNDILVICYSFPPNVGVGGRRWAKFAKCLAKSNYRVHVISNLNKSEKKSEWVDDVDHKNIINHPQSVFYPEVFVSNPSTIIQKISYRMWLLFFKIVSKGTFYDRSFFWKNTIYKTAKQLIKEHQIKNVIVSGPPFRLLYYTAKLKSELKDINLIVDFRDPWTDNTSFLGFDKISKRRMNFEKQMERYVIQNADHIISANEYLTHIFQTKYPKEAGKFSTIINGYDKTEIPQRANQITTNINELNFVLAGTLYADLKYVVNPFLDYLRYIEANPQVVKMKLNFHFYGQLDSEIEKLIRSYALKSVFIHGFKPLAFVKQKLSEADFCLLFTTPHHASNFNTKFYEYISIKKPIIHFSNDGQISDFIIANNLGFAVRPNSFKTDFDVIINAINKNDLHYNPSFNSAKFEIEYLTQEVETLLIS